MRIADICTRKVVSTGGDISVREAAELMREQHVGGLVVIGSPNGERVPIGFITDRDIVLSAIAVGIAADVLTVSDIMRRDVATCTENGDIFSAIQTMQHRHVRRLPVLDSEGGLSGMLSADDIFDALSAHMNALSEALTSEQVYETRMHV